MLELIFQYLLRNQEKYIIALAFSLVVTTEGFTQWTQIATLPVNKISSVQFFDENIGFACGGGVWKTIDGGFNWTQIFTGGANSSYFLDTSIGFATGNPGRIYKTTNGGMNWSTYILTNGLTGVAAIKFFNPTTAVSVGFHIINRTTNAGSNWIMQDSSYFQEQLSVSLLSNGYGWIAGGAPFELVKKTVNYGVTWSPQGPLGPGGLNAVYAIDNNNAYVCGHQGRIRRTTNGGTNWVILDSMTNRSLKSVHFTNMNNGVVVGDNGTILRTTNGGSNWFFQTSGTTNHLYSVLYINSETGWIGGNNGVILKTTNGGFTLLNQLSNNVPREFELHQNFPNPFNPNTKIKFSVKNSGPVSLIVYDVSGKEAERLLHQDMNSGTYEFNWNADGYASGVYFYSLLTESVTLTKKMILIK